MTLLSVVYTMTSDHAMIQWQQSMLKSETSHVSMGHNVTMQCLITAVAQGQLWSALWHGEEPSNKNESCTHTLLFSCILQFIKNNKGSKPYDITQAIYSVSSHRYNGETLYNTKRKTKLNVQIHWNQEFIRINVSNNQYQLTQITSCNLYVLTLVINWNWNYNHSGKITWCTVIVCHQNWQINRCKY